MAMLIWKSGIIKQSLSSFFFVFLFLFAPVNPSYAAYSRIISLAPSITSSLYDLESQDKLVGVTLYCEAKGKVIIGTVLEPNLEKIAALKPDLVLATKEGNSPRVVEKLKEIGLNVFVFEQASNFQEICANFLKLAELVGKVDKAKAIIRNTENQIGLISGQIKHVPKKRIFWQIGARPLVTINEDAFAADLIRFAGGINLFSDLKIAYPRVSYEEVIRRNPEVIILVTMGEVSEREKEGWFEFKEIDAARENKIFVVDSQTVCLPTPLKFLKGLKEIVRLMHPQIE